MCFFEVLNSHNSSKISEKSPDFFNMVQVRVAKNIEDFFVKKIGFSDLA
jgi:hypothetical protein